MRYLSCLTCVVLCGVLALPAIAADPSNGDDSKRAFPLKYRLAPDIGQEVHCDGQYLSASTIKIRFAAEPTYLAEEPLYATIKLGVKKDPFNVVFDKSNSESREYDILYVDANRDGKVTESEKWIGVFDRWRQCSNFGPVKLMVRCCDKEYCPQWFTFQLGGFDRRAPEENIFRPRITRHLTVNNTGYYQGIVTFGEKKRLIAFVDNDGDGLYNNYWSGIYQQADQLVVDYNNDGHLDANYPGEEGQPLCGYVQVGDRYWQLDVAADGASVTIQPVNKPLATVHSPIRNYNLLLSGDDAVVRVRSKDGTALVPAGKYGLISARYQVERAGQRWDFQASAEGEGTVIDAPPDGDVKLVFGPPLVPKVTNLGGTRQLMLNLELRGAGGEVYQNVSLPNAQMPPVPKVRIIDENDKELALLDFHYG